MPRRRPAIVAFAVLASLLVATAMPAVAAGSTTKLVVGASQTTASDFDAGSTSNMTVSGTGSSASVVFAPSQPQIVDSFEDQNLDEYGVGSWGNGKSSFDFSSAWSTEGSYSLHSNGAGQIGSTSGLPAYPAAGDTFYLDFRINTASTGGVRFGWAAQDNTAGDQYGVKIDPSSSNFKLGEWGNSINNGWSSSTSINWDNYVGESLTLKVEWQTDGTQTVTVLDPSGNVIDSLSMTRSGYSSGGIAYQSSGDISWDYYRIGAAQTVSSGSYISAPMSVDNASSGWTDLSLSNVSATVTWQHSTDGGSTWSNVSTATYSASGNYSAGLSGSGEWRVRIGFEATGSSASASLHDDGILFTDHAPSVDSSSMSPADNASLTSLDVTFTVNVSDGEFPTAQGDSVTATLYVDGTQQGTDTLTGNGTASVQATIGIGGNHTYYWTVNDSYGLSSTSPTFTMSTPATLSVWNETQPNHLVNNATVDLKFFANETVENATIITRTTSDGTINLTGLPVGQPFVVVADAPGYYSRRIVIRSIYDQANIYLLAESQASVYNVFELRDKTANYPSDETVLTIEKAINRSGTVKYRTVSGDYFGADNEFKSYLEQGARYRLRIKNENGDTRVLGTYMALDSNNPKVLDVGTVHISLPDGDRFRLETDIKNPDADRMIHISYSDPADETTNFSVRVERRDNSSNITYQDTATDLGNYSALVDLPDDNSQWVVNWTVYRDGQEIHSTGAYGGDTTLPLPLGEPWLGIFSFAFVLFTATLSGTQISTRGAIATVVVAGLLMAFGWLDIAVAFWFIAATIAAGGYLYEQQVVGY